MKRYGPYPTSFGHLFWIDIADDESRRSVFVHREVMELHLGRTLGDDEVVHHKDGDPTNNVIDNLEVLPRTVHAALHGADRMTEMYHSFCPECMKPIEVFMRDVRHKQHKMGRAGPFCGRSCAGRFNQRKRKAN